MDLPKPHSPRDSADDPFPHSGWMLGAVRPEVRGGGGQIHSQGEAQPWRTCLCQVTALLAPVTHPHPAPGLAISAHVIESGKNWGTSF